MAFTLDEVVAKAAELDINVGKLTIVHVDDEALVLKDTKQRIGSVVDSYVSFTDPQQALAHIVEHAGGIDALFLDQFITQGLALYEGWQGTDLLRMLHEQGIVIPTVFFSGEHAKTNAFPILAALNATTGIHEYMGKIYTERRGDSSPVEFTAKSAGINNALMNVVGLVAASRASLFEGYDAFFEGFIDSKPDSPKYVTAKLAYEKGERLWIEAGAFARKFVEEMPAEADILDDSGRPFSRSFRIRCGFGYGIIQEPEVLLSYTPNQMKIFIHEFSRTYRSVFPASIESVDIGEYYHQSVLDNLIRNGVEDLNIWDMEQYVREHPVYSQASEMIREFKREMAGLALELTTITGRLEGNNLLEGYTFNEEGIIINYDDVSISTELDHSTQILSSSRDVNFALNEAIYNAVKVGRQRGITADIEISVTSHDFDDIPDSVKEQFRSYDLSQYSPGNSDMPESVEGQRFVKYSVSDNCGGFDDLEKSLQRGVSTTGSSGIGISTLLDVREDHLMDIKFVNRPGQGATVNFYLMQGV